MAKAKTSRPKGADTVERVAQRLEALVVEWCDPAWLKPNPWNPNRQNEHEFEMLVKSIEDAGFTQPIMVSEIKPEHAEEWAPQLADGAYAMGDLVIVDGEHRWRAAQHIGVSPIPYVKMPYGAVQARLSTLQMNRARGTEDIELATEVLRDLQKLGVLEWAGDRLSMSDAELEGLLTNIPEPQVVAPSALPDLPPTEVFTSPAALRADREHEDRIAAAKTEEERAAAIKDGSTFRLVLSFAGDEADVVRQALAPDPTATVLGWCRTRAAHPSHSA